MNYVHILASKSRFVSRNNGLKIVVPQNPADFTPPSRNQRGAIHGPKNWTNRPGNPAREPGSAETAPRAPRKTARELGPGMWKGIGSSKSGD